MNINQYLLNPDLIDNLDQQSKLQLYQHLQDLHQKSLNEEAQLQGQITTLQNQLLQTEEQIKQFTQSDPQEYLQSLEQQLTQEITTNLQLYKQYQDQINSLN